MMMVMKLFSQQKQKAILMFAFLPLFYSFSRGYGSSCLSKFLYRSSPQRLLSEGKRNMSTSSGDETIAPVRRMNVQELGNVLGNADLRLNYQIIDVREPDELQAVNLPGNDILNLPLSSSGEWAAKIVEGDLLDLNKATICICHHGMRSMRVATFLVGQARFKDVYNIEGGIHQYAVKVDPSIGTY